MKVFAKIQKKITRHHVIAVLGLVGIIVLLSQFNLRKLVPVSGMAVESDEAPVNAGPSPEASKPLGQNGDFAEVSQGETAEKDLPAGVPVSTCDPADLLPIDQNNEWARLNPTGAGDLNSVNLLKAGHHTGIDTVGSSLRNANLQVRSEPPNPTDKVSPWGNSTIEPDLMRVPLELGNCPN